MTTTGALAFDSRVQASLRRYLGALVADATDTGIEGVIESLEPAIEALFGCTPEPLHDALEAEINAIGSEYGIGVEVAHLTRRKRVGSDRSG